MQLQLPLGKPGVPQDALRRAMMSRAMLPPDPPRYRLVLMETRDRARRRQGARVLEVVDEVEQNIELVRELASRLNVAMQEAHPGTLKAWFVVRMPPRNVEARLIYDAQWGGFD